MGKEAEALSLQTGSHQEQLQALESLLAEERRAVEHLRDQLDQAKVYIVHVCFFVSSSFSSADFVSNENIDMIVPVEHRLNCRPQR